MNFVKTISLLLLLFIAAPTIISAAGFIDDLSISVFISELPDGEEERESDSEEILNDIEGFVVTQQEYNSSQSTLVCNYSFTGKFFTDIHTEVVTPPPELI